MFAIIDRISNPDILEYFRRRFHFSQKRTSWIEEDLKFKKTDENNLTLPPSPPPISCASCLCHYHISLEGCAVQPAAAAAKLANPRGAQRSLNRDIRCWCCVDHPRGGGVGGGRCIWIKPKDRNHFSRTIFFQNIEKYLSRHDYRI